MNNALESKDRSPNLASAAKSHWVLISAIFIYSIAAARESAHRPLDLDVFFLAQAILGPIILGALCTTCIYVTYVMVCVRPQRLTHYAWTAARTYLSRQRMLNALPVVVLFPLFTYAFTYLKFLIPVIHPYSWDVSFAQLDAILHGGMHPWMWLQPMFGYPAVTASINVVYNLWFFVIYAIIYWLAFSIERQALRMQFLLSFVFSWIVLGTILATIFSSAGPCFYGLTVAGTDPYGPLMTYLREANQQYPIWALDVQRMLWQGYQEKNSAFAISAMPSMHVATAVLIALLGARINRTCAMASLAFAVVIMIGAVHLGWHYAIDGYVGAIGACVIWYVVGLMMATSARLAARIQNLPSKVFSSSGSAS